MTLPATTLPGDRTGRLDLATQLPLWLALAAFVLLFAKPAGLLLRDWWSDPEAGHGLLLGPAAAWLVWKRGLLPERTRNVGLGFALLLGAVLLRLASELAAELFIMRFSMVMAAGGMVVYYLGLRQALAWWLPFTLLVLAIPLPELIRSTLALPLQFKASQLGATLLEWRNVPVRLAGNIIQLPGHRLFVTEACSGLRSLTALLSLALLMGGIWLRWPVLRAALLLSAVPIAVAINGVRVFLTGFLVYYVDPALGQGFMHLTEGWLLFVVSFGLVGVAAYGMTWIDRWRGRRQEVANA
ncbi:MAG TPA: exosortase/archaeosortase family protein [Gemmatimonadales bacterium]